jgi:hypothetical protein
MDQNLKKQNQQDSVLSVAIRWNHADLVDYLLGSVKFIKKVYVLAMNDAKNGPYQKSLAKFV